jgi:nucleotide-binding universal stress UspA family protein
MEKILVATDGNDAASGALHLARALVQRRAASVEVLSVQEPFPMNGMLPNGTLIFAPPELEAAARLLRKQQVEEQIRAVGAELKDWPLTVVVGLPAPAIVRFARATGASLIVLGLGRHAVADRWFGTETALRVMRLSHVPVLAVPAAARKLPTHAVVAVDFTEFSRDAAEAALRIIQPGGTLHLAHVFWRPSEEIPWVGGRDWVEVQRQQMQGQLEELARQLESAADIHVQAHFLDGDPASEIRHLSDAVGAEVIAAGSHGAGFFSRLLMGSVSTRLVRGANCMVLIAPPRVVPSELEERPPAEHARLSATPVPPGAALPEGG